jgi:ribosomal protein L24E
MGMSAIYCRQFGRGRWFWGSTPVGPNLAVIVAVLLLTAPLGAAAADATFLGTPITPAAGTYLVKRDANVRAAPKTASKRVATLKKNERIDVVGKGPGAWMAVRKDGAELGFVCGTILVPLVDGSLKAPIIGRTAQRKDIECIYSARFIGKNPVSGEAFETSD